MRDRLGREIDYLRVSVTDCCNLNCVYCMPEKEEKTPSPLLTFEEILSVVRCGCSLGLRHVRLTGGEPLVRKGVPSLVKMLKDVAGIETVTITTNGVLLEQYLDELAQSGLDGVNVSLDTMDRRSYEKITGRDFLPQVMEAIKKASRRLPSVKINAVALDMEGIGGDWENLVQLARDYPLDVRFIEVMPVGYGKKFKTIGYHRLFNEIKSRFPHMEQDEAAHGPGPASYYRIPGFQGSIGFIAPIHKKFCPSCNRIRLTCDGYLKTCLCYGDGVSLLPVLRGKAGGGGERERDGKLAALMEEAVWNKPAAHCFDRPEAMTEEKAMIRIGG